MKAVKIKFCLQSFITYFKTCQNLKSKKTLLLTNKSFTILLNYLGSKTLRITVKYTTAKRQMYTYKNE